MLKSTLAWLGWVFAFMVLEALGLDRLRRTGDASGTASWHVAELFHVRTQLGRSILAIVCAGSAGLFYIHIRSFGGPR